MAKQDIFANLMRTFRNPTKMSIIFLLTENGKMTVTQMAEQVNVTKANLYHFVKEMVNDGIVLRPEVRVKKNYVEKYYSLNEAAFKFADPKKAQERLREGSPEDYRALLQSFLTSLGLYFQLFAEEVARADQQKLKAIASAFKDEKIVLHYSLLENAAYEYELSEYSRVIRKSMQKWGKAPGLLSGIGNRLIIVGLPYFNPGQVKGQNTNKSSLRT